MQANNCIGTYVHGILDNAPFVDFLLRPFVDKIGAQEESISYQDFKEKQYDLLADHVRKHLNMEQLYKIMQNND